MAEDLVEGVAADTEFGRVGLAYDHAAPPLHGLDQWIVLLWHEMLQRDTAEGRAHAGDQRQILDCDRQPGEPARLVAVCRPILVEPFQCPARALGADRHGGVDRRLDLRNAAQ